MNIDFSDFRSFDIKHCLQKVLVASGFLILSWEEDKSYPHFVDITIKKRDRQFNLSVNIRNISSARLPGHTSALRRQVEPLSVESLPANTADHLSVLLGVCSIDGTTIVGAWNPFYFVSHSTNRSCYVESEFIVSAYKDGFCFGEYGRVPVYCCREDNLELLFDKYLEENV